MVLFNDSPRRRRALRRSDIAWLARQWPHLEPHVREAVFTLIERTSTDAVDKRSATDDFDPKA